MLPNRIHATTMKSQHRLTIWVIGESVLSDGIAASLQALQPGSQVVRKGIDLDFFKQYTEQQPQLIIYEKSSPDFERLIQIIRQEPGLCLLGIDLEGKPALLTQNAPILTESMAELSDLVLELARASDTT
jgi:hypothetical protein